MSLPAALLATLLAAGPGPLGQAAKRTSTSTRSTMAPTPDASVASEPQVSQSAGQEPVKATLYQRLGGEGAVNAAVDIFYKAIIADPELAPFFEGVDMEKQRRKQAAFMTFVFGGAGSYSGRDLGRAHAHLIKQHGLTVHHFNLVAGHLDATLRGLGVPDELRGEAMAVVATAKPAIFGPDA